MTNNTGKIPIQIACGVSHIIILMSDGYIYGCGNNTKGQLGTGNTSNTNTLISMIIPANMTTPILLQGYQIENNNLVCFNEGSKILCLKNNSEIYEPIENLRNGDLIKTVNNGFKPIVMIGRSFMFNKAEDKRIKDQLYICKKEDYPELIEDLIITGRHSILVDYLTDKEKEETLRYFKNIYVTDNKYRLMAYIDERTKVYQMQGYHTIYHLALENDNYYGNYGIYANGLLVESCSKRTLRELSKMTLI
jgi:hypothetical protein